MIPPVPKNTSPPTAAAAISPVRAILCSSDVFVVCCMPTSLLPTILLFFVPNGQVQFVQLLLIYFTRRFHHRGSAAGGRGKRNHLPQAFLTQDNVKEPV